MDEAIVTALLNNAATLLVLSIILDITNQFFRKNQRVKEIIRGILISLICFAIMRMPFVIQTGIVFDTRSILISVAGLIFGVIPTVITVLAAIIIRISMGGSGALPGIAVILSSAMSPQNARAKSVLCVNVHSERPSPGTITFFPSRIRSTTEKHPALPCKASGTLVSPYV